MIAGGAIAAGSIAATPVSGGAAALAGDGTAVATGTADLSTAISPSADGTATATGTADLTTAIPLTADGTAVATGTADLTAGSGLAADGTATATGTADLSTAISPAADGTAVATGTADLTTAISPAAVGVAVATGVAALTVQVEYPAALPQSGVNVTPQSGIQSDTSPNGIVGTRCNYTATPVRIEVPHKIVSAAERDELLAFYAANKHTRIRFTRAKDGTPYNVIFLSRPAVRALGSNYYSLNSSLMGQAA